jgi:hypothetical protein
MINLVQIELFQSVLVYSPKLTIARPLKFVATVQYKYFIYSTAFIKCTGMQHI